MQHIAKFIRAKLDKIWHPNGHKGPKKKKKRKEKKERKKRKKERKKERAAGQILQTLLRWLGRDRSRKAKEMTLGSALLASLRWASGPNQKTEYATWSKHEVPDWAVTWQGAVISMCQFTREPFRPWVGAA